MAVNENTTPPQVPSLIVLPKSSQDKLIDYGVKGILIVGLVWGGRKLIKDYIHNRAEDRVATTPEAQQATELRLAINPSGHRALWWVDGKNVDAVFNTAKNIKDFKEVISEYRKHYNGDNLTDDLRSKLSADDLKRFLNTVNYNNLDPKTNKAPSGLDYSQNKVVIAKGKTNVRKTPKLAGNPHFYSKSNVIITADAGTAIGITTGRQHFDEQAKPSGILFIEVHVLKKNAPIKESYIVWIAASQVQTITAAEYKQKKYPALAITEEEYDKATAPLNGNLPNSMNADYNKEIVTTSNAPVLNNTFQVTGQAEKNTILGFPIMELNTGDRILLQFLTIDDTVRWVNKQFIKILPKK